MSFLMLDDFTVPGYGLSVGLSAALKDEDASGETSGTARAQKGKKGKRLEVRCSVQFHLADKLRELMRVAEATENGDAKVYTVTNDTANAAGMRQGTFRGTIRVDEDEILRKWNVSFTLAEYISVPEMAEAREPKKEAAAQTSEGEAVQPKEEPKQARDVEERLTMLEKVFKALDSAIGNGE